LDRDKEQTMIIAAYQRLFNTEDGKIVLEDLKKKSTYNRSAVLDKLNINPNQILYDEAQRSMVLYIERNINIDLKERKN